MEFVLGGRGAKDTHYQIISNSPFAPAGQMKVESPANILFSNIPSFRTFINMTFLTTHYLFLFNRVLICLLKAVAAGERSTDQSYRTY
jgi:hypothetical protein